MYIPSRPSFIFLTLLGNVSFFFYCPAILWWHKLQNIFQYNRPIANMAMISPKRGFSVATVARGWLPVFTCAVAGKPAASQASFPLDATKISQFSSLTEVSIWHVRFEYCFSMLNWTINWRTAITDRVICSDRDTLTAWYFSFIVFKVHL